MAHTGAGTHAIGAASGARSDQQSLACFAAEGIAAHRVSTRMAALRSLRFLSTLVGGGLGVLGFFLAAVPMAVSSSRRQILVPRGFGLWLLLLVWVVAGISVLWVDAPGAVPVEGMGRLVPFAFRLGWYIVATIVLLYIGSFSRRAAATVALLAWMFLVTVVGGYLGKFAPTLEFPSLLEIDFRKRSRGMTSCRY